MDLSNLMEWARKRQLRFNADKCESMRITYTGNKFITQYMLDKPLKDVKSFKDLGDTIPGLRYRRISQGIIILA